MLASLKILAPGAIYVLGILLICLALTGRVQGLLWYIIALIPLRNVIDKLHQFPMGKDLLDICLLVAIFGWVLGAISRKEKVFESSPINAIAIVMVVYTFFSLLQGSAYLHEFNMLSPGNPRVQSWKNFCTMPLLFFLVFNNIKKERDIFLTLVVICGMMAFMDLYLLRQIAWYQSIVSRTKIKGTFVYLGPNEIAAFYNMYTMILLSLYFFTKKKIPKLVLLGLCVANTFIILFLFSRGAYVGLAIGFFCLFCFKKRWLLIPLVLAALLWQVVLPEKVIDRINQTTNEYGELDESTQIRLALWRKSVELFKSNPVTGVGYSVFGSLRKGALHRDTHNIYLKILVEQGIIGMIIFLLLLLSFFRMGVQLYSRSDDEDARGLGLGLAVAVFVLLANNMFGNRWTYLEVCSTFWVFAALVARLRIMANEQYEKKMKKIKRKEAKKLYGRAA